MFDATATRSHESLPSGSLGAAVERFQAGAGLVDAALAALTRIAYEIETMRAMIGRDADFATIETSIALIRWHLDAATVGGDNLLMAVEPSISAKPLLIVAVSKSAAGTLTTQTIAIDRGPMLLSGAVPGASTAFDRLAVAFRSRPPGTAVIDPVGLTRCLDRLSDRVETATSRLSIIKARLDLQSSFVTAVADADMGASAARQERRVSQASARDLALETRHLLSQRPVGIGTWNRQVLQTLFERHGL